MKRIFGLSIFLFFALSMASSHAAVYKWVDAEGNTHFSDNPQDAARASEVDVTSVNTMEGGQELADSAARRKERELEAADKAQQAALDAPDLCKEDVDKYRAFTEQQYFDDGRPKRYYLNNEDGSSMTEREQNSQITELGESLRARGCL